MRALTARLEGEGATLALGKALAESCRRGDVFALVGPLGAGKTTWTRGLARGLGLPDGVGVRSPTFTLCNEYPCRLPLLHLDLYRLAGADEADAIGFRERVGVEGVAVIEWSDRFPDLIPSHALWLLFEYEESVRRVTLWEGAGGDISWAGQLAPPAGQGDFEWVEVDRPGPWEGPASVSP
ncbi:MAG: tRNA (adenosine(37)-N6)-threonylcarbamoyltransferase complex ATPase subunit type 1 TsaE [Myxococcota bacterium]|nr:tRNA (adenosine(37)-N6)-threonylcarbamoyltransferase complex ATPase subunit type 1 TsaE [Myxococcota bacterium]